MKRRKKYCSSLLFTKPSFLRGFGSVLNLAGNYFPMGYSVSEKSADYKALEADWGMIGQDMEGAFAYIRNADKSRK